MAALVTDKLSRKKDFRKRCKHKHLFSRNSKVVFTVIIFNCAVKGDSLKWNPPEKPQYEKKTF